MIRGDNESKQEDKMKRYGCNSYFVAQNNYFAVQNNYIAPQNNYIVIQNEKPIYTCQLFQSDHVNRFSCKMIKDCGSSSQ